jgi:cell division protein FtsQ
MSNRRVGKQKLPPDVLEAQADEEELVAEPDGIEDALLAGGPPNGVSSPPRPRGRVARALSAIAGAVVVVGVSLGVAHAARSYITTSPRFDVRTIVVSGAQTRSTDAIEDTAGLRRGENIFTLDLDNARARLLADPWIRQAELGRRLPGTVLVDVVEREAAAVVSLGESYLASRDGEVFKRLEPGDPSDFPVITGLSADQVAADREGVVRTIRRALDLASDYEQGPLARKAPLQEIHLSPSGDVTLVVGKSGLSLVLGDPPYRKKLEQAARVLGELDKRGGKADAILLDNQARPERVVVRMR